MAREVKERYASAQEMVETIFGSEHIRNSVSHFRPEELSVIAAKVAEKVRLDTRSPAKGPKPPAQTTAWDKIKDVFSGEKADEDLKKVTQAVHQGGKAASDWIRRMEGDAAAADPLSLGQRWTLATFASLMICIVAAALAGDREWIISGLAALGMTLGGAAGMVVAHRTVARNIERESWLSRMAHAGGAVLGALLLGGPGILLGISERVDVVKDDLARVLIVIACGVVLMDWPEHLAAGRRERLSLGIAIGCGGVTFAMGCWLLAGEWGANFFATAISAGIALVAQTLCPFNPTGPRISSQPPASPANAQDDEHTVVYGDLEYPPDLDPKNYREYDQVYGNVYYPAHAKGVARPPKVVYGSIFYGKTKAEHLAEQNRFSGETSPRLRLVALLLATPPLTFVPICGLHRFYVGKIGTGILWLCTFGLLYIGQLIDLILIVAGGFTDSDGRTVRQWTEGGGELAHPQPAPPTAAAPRPVVAPRPVFAAAQRPGPWVDSALAAAATMLTMIAMVIGLLLASRVLDLAYAGAFGKALSRDMETEFGVPYQSWASIAHTIGWIVFGSFMGAAAAALVVSRRSRGALHIVRGLAGLGALVIPIAWLRDEMMQRFRPLTSDGQMMQMFVDHLGQSLLVVMICFVGAVVLLAWPPRERTPSASPAHGDKEP